MTKSNNPSPDAKPSRENEKFEEFSRIRDLFDVAEALERLRGNRKLFCMLVKDFATDYASTVEKIGEAIDANDDSEARALIHVIRGVAGNLSASGLETAAAELGDTVKRGERERRWAKFNRLKEIFGKIAASVENLGIENGVGANDKPENPSALKKLDGGQIADRLGRLGELLSEFNIEAETFLEDIMPELAGIFPENDLAVLEHEISSLDYKSAYTKLNRMAENYGIDLS